MKNYEKYNFMDGKKYFQPEHFLNSHTIGSEKDGGKKMRGKHKEKESFNFSHSNLV